jgi:hypothetical protein
MVAVWAGKSLHRMRLDILADVEQAELVGLVDNQMSYQDTLGLHLAGDLQLRSLDHC